MKLINAEEFEVISWKATGNKDYDAGFDDGVAFVIEKIDNAPTIDALALLKAQEPRVMTLGEAKSAYVVEYRSGKMREIGSALLDLNVDPLNAEYGKIYRVWTSRPTDEQRRVTPWE